MVAGVVGPQSRRSSLFDYGGPNKVRTSPFFGSAGVGLFDFQLLARPDAGVVWP